MAEQIKVAESQQLEEGHGLAVDAQGRRLALFRSQGKVYAVENACPHIGAPLAHGPVDGTTLMCPVHGAQFDLATGKVLSPPADQDLASFPALEKDGGIYVEV